ncbi:MAG: hypothetical protein IJ019_04430, partial [Alphaproteobacteria bacterium]|nr:hypothetical protein [Alphaproteobacteria bacterium]
PEVRAAIDVFYDGDAFEGTEKMTERVRNYVKSKEPEWKVKYFGEKPKPQESYSSNTIKVPSNFAQVDTNNKKPTFQPYPDNDNYPKYDENEFLPNGDINFMAVYDRVKKEHPKPKYYDFNNVFKTTPLSSIINLKADYNNYKSYKNKSYHDKYKHAMMNCLAAQRGIYDASMMHVLSEAKEYKDLYGKTNMLWGSNQDMGANNIGNYLGYLYPEENCHDLISPYISDEYPYK